jgi:hypothetical protein
LYRRLSLNLDVSAGTTASHSRIDYSALALGLVPLILYRSLACIAQHSDGVGNIVHSYVRFFTEPANSRSKTTLAVMVCATAATIEVASQG